MSTSTLAKPTEAPKNFEPIRVYMSTAFGSPETSATVFSQSCVMVFMLLARRAGGASTHKRVAVDERPAGVDVDEHAREAD